MFPTFFQAGFECSCGVTPDGGWFDLLESSQHPQRLWEDYQEIRRHGIRVAREGIRWPLVDRKGRYDFSTVRPFVDAARALSVTPVWDLFHFGYPKEADPFSDGFIDRFQYYCYAVGKYLSQHAPPPYFVTPVNQPSFLAWAGAEIGRIAPFATKRGGELKVQLAKAAIRGIDALREALPEVRIVNVDPICHAAVPFGRPELAARVDHFNDTTVFESLDMIAGRLLPDLGGSRRHLDIVGVSYYPASQWEWESEGTALAVDDPRRVPLSQLLRLLWNRYQTEIVIAETSDTGDHRGWWIRELSKGCRRLDREGVPMRGVCLYPFVSQPGQPAEERAGLLDPENDGAIDDAFHALHDAQMSLCPEDLEEGIGAFEAASRHFGQGDAPLEGGTRH